MFSGNIKYPFAYDKDKKIINIMDAVRGDYFTCAFCGSRMIAKKGEVYTHHFAHLGTCIETWHYDQMTQWHKDWQNEFPKECQEVMLKRGNTRHIADILINNYVIEFQHSKISDKEFLDRNRFYTSLGYKLIWIFDFINGENDTNIDLLCKIFKDEKQDIFIYKELSDKTLKSIDEEEIFNRNDFINDIRNNNFPEYRKSFTVERYSKFLNRKKTRTISNIAKEEVKYYNPPEKQFIFGPEVINHKRNLPGSGDSINEKNSDRLEDIIELNRGRNYWLICENTGDRYYFENTESNSSMKVWIKHGESASELDEVHQWETLLAFKAYRWRKIR